MKWIKIFTITLFSILTVLSFVLSFESLVTIAQENGKPGWQGMMWPFLIDGGLIIFSLSVVYSHLQQESKRLQWILVIVFTILTVVFNLVQAPAGLVSKAVAFMPPIVLFLTFERLMSILQAGVQRSDYLSNLDILQAESVQKQAEIDRLATKVKRLKRQEERLETTPVEDIIQPETTTTIERQQHLLDILAAGENNKTRIAERLGVARSTVYNDIETLKRQGALSKNGQHNGHGAGG